MRFSTFATKRYAVLIIKRYSVLLVIALFVILGIGFFIWSTRPPIVKAPKGPILVGTGPYPEAQINKTEIFISIPDNSIDVRVTLRFNESRKYFAYAFLPFLVSKVEPYIIFQQSIIHRDLQSEIGNLSYNFMNSTKGSSIANVTFQPNVTSPVWWFFPPDFKAELTLAMSFRLTSNMISIADSFGAGQTVILTFFGDVMGIFESKMNAYMRPNSRQTLDWPFIVFMQIPPDAYLSASYPPAIEYYVKEERRWVMFSLDFLDGRYAQTISCSFINPTRQALRESVIFTGGIFIGIGASLIADLLKEFIERKKG